VNPQCLPYPTQLESDFKHTKGSTALLTDPCIDHTYVAWRFVDKSGEVHKLASAFAGGTTNNMVLTEGETELYSEQLLAEGSFEVEFWTDFKTVQVSFEVKIELGDERVKFDEYKQQIRQQMTEFVRMRNAK
jgi:hypothetical protein